MKDKLSIFVVAIIVILIFMIIPEYRKPNYNEDNDFANTKASAVPPEGATRIIFLGTLPNCNIYVNDSKYSTVTDTKGNAELVIYEDSHSLKIELKLNEAVKEQFIVITETESIVMCSGRDKMLCQVN